MVRKIGVVLFLAAAAVGAVREPPLQGLAFADFYQQDGKPCPPECVTDTMEIMTWYPSPWNSYEELYTMKLGVGDVTTFTESELKPNKVGSIKVAESVVFKPKDNDPDSWYSGDAEAGELVYSSQKDAFYHYNGQTWVPQTSSGGKAIIQTFCPWRNDYREGSVGVGFASNWGMDKNGAGSYPCDPPACPLGFDNLGIIGSESLSVACSGNDASCYWGGTGSSDHPVSSGRVVRACREQ